MYQPLSLAGKIAVVIGGTSGIGSSLSLGLAEAGTLDQAEKLLAGEKPAGVRADDAKEATNYRHAV